MQDNLNNYLRDQLSNAEMPPPEGTWDRIEKGLPVHVPWYSRYKYAALACLAFLFIDGYLLYDRFQNEEGDKVVKNEKNIVAPPALSIHPASHSSPGNNLSPQKSNPVAGSMIKPESATSRKQKTNRLQYYTTPAVQQHNISVDNFKDPQTASENYTAVYNKQELENILADIQTGYKAVQPSDEDSRTKEKEAMLVSIDPVKGQLLSAPTGKEILLSLSPEKEVNRLANKTAPDKSSIKNQRYADAMKQFKVYDVGKGFHAGVFFGGHVNLITMKDAFLDRAENDIVTKSHYGKNYGLSVGYDFSAKWGIQLEWNIRSSQGQNYIEHTLAGPVKKQLKLDYMKLPFLVKYKIMPLNSFGHRPIFLSVVAGPQLSFLRKQEYLVDGKKTPLNNAPVNKSEIGVIGGLDVDLYMSKNFYMTFGTRIGICSPVQKNLPMSFQWGFSTALNFRNPPRK